MTLIAMGRLQTLTAMGRLQTLIAMGRLQTLTAMGSAALAATVPYLGKMTRISRKGK